MVRCRAALQHDDFKTAGRSLRIATSAFSIGGIECPDVHRGHALWSTQSSGRITPHWKLGEQAEMGKEEEEEEKITCYNLLLYQCLN